MKEKYIEERYPDMFWNWWLIINYNLPNEECLNITQEQAQSIIWSYDKLKELVYYINSIDDSILKDKFYSSNISNE
jgi:hypothetical protein